jgi:gliding motility-associated-like protein
MNADTVFVFLDGTLYVPNAFSPNGDGINDSFAIQGLEIVKFKLQIFDRWGLQFFYSDNIMSYWDGTLNGELVPIDTYVWKIEYEDSWGRIGQLIGHVSVIR